jgi:NRPS condensation-like uncharacterized protein
MKKRNSNNIPRRFPARLMDCYTDHQTQVSEMMIQLEMEFDKELDAKRLAKAVDLTLDAEPVLGCRFVDNSYKPFFERLDVNKRSAFFPANSQSEYEAFKHSSIDHRTGPQLNVCLWHSSNGDRLLLKASHHVADAAGIKDIAAILSDTYRRLMDNPAYRPAPNSKEQRSLLQVLKHVPLHAYPGIFLLSLRTTWTAYNPPHVHSLYTSDGPREPLTYVNRLIPSGRVSALAEYGHSHNATLNDIIIVAAYRVLAATGKRKKGSHISLTNTIDLRRHIPSGHAAAVANLSFVRMYWPDLGVEPCQNFEATLDKVAKTTRHAKAHWFGLDTVFNTLHPISKIMPHAWFKKIYREYMKLLLKKQGGAHWFTNIGPIDTESVNFGLQPSKAHFLPPVTYPPAPFMFSLSGYNGTLTLSAGAYPTQKDTIEQFFDAILKELPV